MLSLFRAAKSIFYPLCYAVWPVLLLWLNNIDIVRFASVQRSLFITAALSIALSVVLVPIIKNSEKRSLVMCLWWIFFFSYGLLLWDQRDGNTNLPSHFVFLDYYFLALYILMFVLAIFITLHPTRSRIPIHANTIIGSMGVFFIAITLIQIGITQVRAARVSIPAAELSIITKVPSAPPAYLPDVYYIVLDAHGRADVLQELFQYDSTDFIRQLNELGFYVATDSHSNYPYTYLSIPSALHMRYLNDVVLDLRSYVTDRRPFLQMLGYSEAYAFLKKYGYSFVTFGSGWSADSNLPTSDVHFENPVLLNEFENMLLGNSIVVPFGYKHIQYYLHREGIKYFFEHLPEVSKIDGPTFAYAHTMVPHPPFVFGRQGEPLVPDLPFVLDDLTWRSIFSKTPDEYIKGYHDQVTYIDGVLIDTIRKILAASSEPPVIIIQGDHGPASIFNDEDLTVAGVRERFPILNAYYLPRGTTTARLYPTITPINSFRAVFNQYFGTELDFLEDKSYIPVQIDTPPGYEVLDITPYLLDSALEPDPLSGTSSTPRL